MRKFLLLIALMTALPAGASVHRDRRQVYAFRATHACPSTHQFRGACPGHVVDHIKSLFCGGPDRPSNMQWQTLAESKAKDRWENKGCRR